VTETSGFRWATQAITANGIHVALHRAVATPAGPALGGRRTVLLLHGFLDAGRTWDRVAAPLARAGYEVLAPDLRGFGDSGRIPKGGYYHFADYVADVDDIVEQLAPTWLAVVGHSMGGGVASLFAGTRPEKVKRLAILEGLGPAADPPDLSVLRMRAWLRDLGKIERTPRRLASMDHVIDRLAATHPRIDRALLATRAPLLTRGRDDGTFEWAYDPLHRSTTPNPFQVDVFNTFLRHIECPTLFVDGGPTGWHPPDEESRLAHIPKLERIAFPEAGHMMHWTAAGPLADALLRFLADP
jgi:pimeloyl-ACP methyl ester carboxylesterase